MNKTPNEIFQEYLNARLQGEKISPEALIEKFPEHKDFLLKKIAAMELMPFSENDVSAQGGLSGQTIGDFKVIKEIGSGGMGTVYLAEQMSLKRKVALKVLSRSLFADKKLIDRFRKEGQIIAKLQHHRIVPVYLVGETKESFFIAMQYVEGLPLSKLIKNAKDEGKKLLEPGEVRDLVASELTSEECEVLAIPSGETWTEIACNIIESVAEAVDYAHHHNVLHRDIKPSNIILTKNGDPVLLDFGLSKDLSAIDNTATKELLGTPAYSAPEQLFTKHPSPDIRSDIYSLGMTLYELLTFNLPYAGESFADFVISVKSKEPTPPNKFDPSMPGTLNSIIMKAIDKDAKRRYQNVGEFLDDLKAFLSNHSVKIKYPPKRNRRKSLYVAVAVAFAVVLPLLAHYFYTHSMKMNLDDYLFEIGKVNQQFISSSSEEIKGANTEAPESKIALLMKLYGDKYSYYLNVHPKNESLKSIHEHLLLAYSRAYDSYDCLLKGFNDGSVKMLNSNGDFSDGNFAKPDSKYKKCYFANINQFKNEYSSYRNMLAPLINKEGLKTEFTQAFPESAEIENLVK